MQEISFFMQISIITMKMNISLEVTKNLVPTTII